MIFRYLLNNLEDWGYVPCPFQFSNVLQLHNNQLYQNSRVSFFEKLNEGNVKMVNFNH